MTSGPLILSGHAVSNYVNICRMALLEKGIVHQYVQVGASQDEAFLKRNPMGKIPVLETSHGFLAETVAILEYLDESYPHPSLRPEDIFARARMRQMINILQVYIEVPARALYPRVFASAPADEALSAATMMALERSIGALRRMIGNDAYLLGSQMTQADIFAFYTFELVERVTNYVWKRSIIAELGLKKWRTKMVQRPSAQKIELDFVPAFLKYLIDRNASARALELFADA